MFPSEITVMTAVTVLRPILFSAAQVYSPASYNSMSWILRRMLTSSRHWHPHLRCCPVLDRDTLELGLTILLLFHQVMSG